MSRSRSRNKIKRRNTLGSDISSSEAGTEGGAGIKEEAETNP